MQNGKAQPLMAGVPPASSIIVAILFDASDESNASDEASDYTRSDQSAL
jgi:hypothetical protein